MNLSLDHLLNKKKSKVRGCSFKRVKNEKENDLKVDGLNSDTEIETSFELPLREEEYIHLEKPIVTNLDKPRLYKNSKHLNERAKTHNDNTNSVEKHLNSEDSALTRAKVIDRYNGYEFFSSKIDENLLETSMISIVPPSCPAFVSSFLSKNEKILREGLQRNEKIHQIAVIPDGLNMLADLISDDRIFMAMKFYEKIMKTIEQWTKICLQLKQSNIQSSIENSFGTCDSKYNKEGYSVEYLERCLYRINYQFQRSEMVDYIVYMYERYEIFCTVRKEIRNSNVDEGIEERAKSDGNMKNLMEEQINWTFAHKDKVATTHYRIEEDGTLSVRLEGLVDGVSIFEQISVLREADYYYRFAPFVSQCGMVHEYSKTDFVNYFQISIPLIAARDGVLRVLVCDCTEEGEVLVCGGSVDSTLEIHGAEDQISQHNLDLACATSVSNNHKRNIDMHMKHNTYVLQKRQDVASVYNHLKIDNANLRGKVGIQTGKQSKSSSCRMPLNANELYLGPHQVYLPASAVPSRPKTPSIFNDRLLVKKLAASLKIDSPTTCLMIVVVNIDPRVPLPQSLINLVTKKIAGKLLSLFHGEACKISKEWDKTEKAGNRSNYEQHFVHPNPYVHRMLYDDFYNDYFSYRVRVYMAIKKWELSTVKLFFDTRSKKAQRGGLTIDHIDLDDHFRRDSINGFFCYVINLFEGINKYTALILNRNVSERIDTPSLASQNISHNTRSNQQKVADSDLSSSALQSEAKKQKDSTYWEDKVIPRDHRGWLFHSLLCPFFLLPTFYIILKPIHNEMFTSRHMLLEFMIITFVFSIYTSLFVILYKWKKGSFEDYLGSRALIYFINQNTLVLGLANLGLLFIILCTIYKLGNTYELYESTDCLAETETVLINRLCSRLRTFFPGLNTHIARIEEEIINFLLYIDPLIPVVACLERYFIATLGGLFLYLRTMETNS